MYTDPVVQLPVVHDGQLVIYEWGNRGNKESKLPRTGWCRNESLEAGKWRWLSPEPVEIPADFGLEKGVWVSNQPRHARHRGPRRNRAAARLHAHPTGQPLLPDDDQAPAHADPDRAGDMKSG